MFKGHANFLDVLVSELDISDGEDEAAAPVQGRATAVHDEPVKEDVEGEQEEVDDEDTASDSWSECDSSDDEDHALVRTVSGRPSATDTQFGAQERSHTESTTGNVEDYFQFDHPESTVIAVQDVLDLGEVEQRVEDYKKDAIVSVTVASETMTPLASPTDEV
jgi:hypothetical protein